MLQKSLLHLGHASFKCSMFISVLGKKVFGSPWTTLIRNHYKLLSVKTQLGLLPGHYQTATGLLPGKNQTKLLMKTVSLLCIAIPRVSDIFFTFQGLSCTTELYQPQCQPAPHWPPKCNGYGSLVHVLNFRTLRFDSGESMHTRNSQDGFTF